MRQRSITEGMRFGRLVVVRAYQEKKGRFWKHLVKCDCGAEKLISGNDMAKGGTISCGCARKRHGMTGSPEYAVWASMIQRCQNSNNSAYKNYGGRGVTVCDDWLIFDNFIEDMGEKPDEALTLERIDNSKGYSKDNCEWATRFEQAKNQRVRRDNKTGVTGVCFVKDRGLYVAHIQRNKERKVLGMFSNKEDAIAARRNAEI